MTKNNTLPQGYNNITPYLIVQNAKKAIDFYKKVFNAEVKLCMERPNDKIGHSELQIGDSKIMLADECPEMKAHSPETYGGSPITLYLYVDDVDTLVQQAKAAGAEILRPVETMFYGDRNGTIKDPFGHVWSIATHVEDVSLEELKKRSEKLFGSKQ